MAHRARPARGAVVGAILAVAVVPMVLAGCGGPVAQAHGGKAKAHGTKVPDVAQGTVPVSIPTADPAALVPPSGSVFVATATVASLPVYGLPRALAPEQTLANPNPLGAPLTLLVKAVEGGWLEVYLPERPNESTGWVTDNNVSLATDAYRIVVNLGARQVTLYRGGAQVVQDSAAVENRPRPRPRDTSSSPGMDSRYGEQFLGPTRL